MSWGAIIVGVVGAGATAYSANKQKKAAEAAAKQGSSSNQTTTTTPWNPIRGDLDAIMAGARNQYANPGKIPKPVGSKYEASPEYTRLLGLLGDRAEAGGSSLLQSGSSAMQGALGDQFMNNPFYGALAGTLGQGSTGTDLLRDFITGGAPEGYTPGLGYDVRTGGPPGAQEGVGRGVGGQRGTRAGGGTGLNLAAFQRPAGGNQGGLFGENIGEFLDWQEVGPETQALLDIMQRESGEDQARSVADLESRMAGAGRLGGGAWAAARGQVAEQGAQEAEAARSGLLYQDLGARRNAALEALGLLNQRDLGEMSINASQASAAGSAATAREIAQMEQEARMRGLDIEEMLGTRGMDLQGIDRLMGNEEYRLGLGGELAGMFGSERNQMLSLIPGMEEASLAPFGMALEGYGQIDQGRAAASARNASARNAYNQQVYEQPGRTLDDYMSRILALSDRYSTTSGAGTAHSPAPYTPNPYLTGAMTGLGAFASIYGNQQPAARQPTPNYNAPQGSGFQTGDPTYWNYGR